MRDGDKKKKKLEKPSGKKNEYIQKGEKRTALEIKQPK